MSVADSACPTREGKDEIGHNSPIVRCAVCSDSRVIYGPGGWDAPCPACYELDAEAGLAMLGGAGRG